MTVQASEAGGQRSSTMSFLIGVREVNRPPVIQPISDFNLAPNQVLDFTALGADADLPPQALTYQITGLPSGASFEPTTGHIHWDLGADPVAGTSLVTVRVTDNGAPEGSVETTFKITVGVEPRVAINEIMRRPSVAGAEYIELANLSMVNTVDISGWRLEGFDYTFPAGTIIPGGGYLCVAPNLASFRNAYGAQVPVAGPATLALPPNGGLVQLIRPGAGEQLDAVIDAVQFELSAPWPAPAINQGASLQLIDPTQDHRRVSNWGASASSVANPADSILPVTASWRYYQNAAFPGNNWNASSFNDASWPQGGGLLYVEGAQLPAPKTTELTLGPTTYYFRAKFNFSGNPEGAKLVFRTFLDDGAVFYLNGREVFRIGMAEGPVSQSDFSSRVIGDAAEEGPFEVAATGLAEGENVIAVEVHQTNAGSTDIVFGANVDLISLKPSSYTPGAKNSIAASVPAYPPVWINEIEPQNSSGIKDQSGASEPWIELYNGGEESARLDGWALSDQFTALGKWTFPAGALVPAKGYLLIFADGEAQQTTSAELHASFRLAAQTGSVALSRVQNGALAVVDYLNYSGLGPNQSFGRALDGEPFITQLFTGPSPGGSNSNVLAQAPTLEVSLTADRKLRLVWDTVAGVSYRLETTRSLQSPEWELVAQQNGTGTPFERQEALDDGPRFFRLVAE
jgi:hypothetical protein